MFHLHSLCLIFCFVYFSNQKLLGVIQFFRHGARTPISYSDDAIKYFFPLKKGELTNVGFEQMKKKGAETRIRYQEILKDIEVNEDYLQVISTRSQRTVTSSLAFMKGMSENLIPRFDVQLDKNLSEDTSGNFLDNQSFIPTKAFNVHVISPGNKFIYSETCIQYDDQNFYIDCANDRTPLTTSEMKLIDNLRNHFPLMFKEFDENFEVTVCPQESTAKRQFPSEITGTLYSVSYHNKSYIDPEVLKLSQMNWIRHFFSTFTDSHTKQTGTFMIRIIKSFLQNVNNCDGEVTNINANANAESEIALVEKLVKCKKYILALVHDQTIVSITRSLFKYNDLLNELENEYATRSYNDPQLEDLIYFFYPPYGGDLTIELHQFDDGAYNKFVKLFSNGHELKNLPIKTYDGWLKGPKYTENGIPLESFLTALESRIDRNTKVLYPCPE